MFNATKLFFMSALLVVASSASAYLDPSQYTCVAWPNDAFATQICAKNETTGQCTQSWSFKNDNATKSKQKEAMNDCQRALGNIVTSWNPDNYYCDVFPNAAFPTQICAKSKTTGQCSTSWHFKNDNSSKSKQQAAMNKCERHLGLVVSKWNPNNYYCQVYPNAAFATQVCAMSKAHGQCTHSWAFKNDNATKSKQKEAMAKCEAFLN